MKTSNRILTITGIVIALILLISVIGSRIFLNKYTDSYTSDEIKYTGIEIEYKEIVDFSGLNITGDWDITLNKGDSFSISINGRKGTEEPYKIYKKGTTLFLTENTDQILNSKLRVDITMPEIKEVYSAGGLKLNLNDFFEPELILNLTGGSWVDGSGCEFENLYLTSAGAINLEFENVLTDNAELQLAGAGNIELNMNGGSLTGNASGAMNIEYSGNARQEVQTAGLASISQNK